MNMLKFKDSYEPSWTCVMFVVLFFYFLSHGLMMLLNGAWWDDLNIWNITQETLNSRLGPDCFNVPFIYYLTDTLNKTYDKETQLFIYKILAFIGNSIPVITSLLIFKKIGISRTGALVISLLVATCAINKTMPLIICLTYTYGNALFFLGLLVFVYDFYKPNLFLKTGASVIWCISLCIWRSPILVIPLVVSIAIIVKYRQKNWKTIQTFAESVLYGCRNYFVIIIGLIVFTILYKTVLAPHGIYAAYYSISPKAMLVAPFTSITAIIGLHFGYLGEVFSIMVSDLYNFIFSLILIALFTPLVFRLKWSLYENNWKFLLLFAAAFAYAGILPQELRCIIPLVDIGGYGSRVASLSYLPVAIIACYVLSKISIKLGKTLFICLLSGSILCSINLYTNYNVFWAKKEAISFFLKNNEYLKGKSILVYDTDVEYNAFIGEKGRTYDFEGCARLAYGKDTDTKFYSFYNREYESLENADYKLLICKNESYNKFHIFYSRLFDKKMYDKIIEDMVLFKITNNNERY